jgi:nucleoside-diphosphate-sugar epimerase
MKKMADILVTGATGFLGTNITLQLVDQGYHVRAFGLPNSETKYIQSPKVDIVYGDITQFQSINQAMKNIDLVIHVAGDTSWWKKTVDRQYRINVDGVRNVMQAAVENHVKKVVHTSTATTFGYNPNGLTNETWDNFNIGNLNYHYAISKREGEKIALDFAKNKLNVSVINPGGIIGPFDYTLQFGRLFLNIRDRNLQGIPCGGTSWAHVAEVAKAHISALDKGRTGERYICAGINASYQEVFQEIAASMKVTPPTKILTARSALFFGYVAEFLSNFTKKPPQLNPGRARWMSLFPKYDSSKAIKELGYKIVPIRKMIEDARDWYHDQHFL